MWVGETYWAVVENGEWMIMEKQMKMEVIFIDTRLEV